MWFIKHYTSGEILNINQEKTSIGRLGTTHVLKNDESISRKHCTFLLMQNELRIVDDGAKYGTTIQSTGVKKVTKEPMTLNDGDKVQFGCYENIWEIHCKHETRGGIKRKSDDAEAIENNLSVSNISKKPKENPINAKIVDKFDIIVDSDEDLPSKSSRSARHRMNLIDYSEDVVPSTSKVTESKNKNVTKIDDKLSQVNKKVDQVQAKKQQDKIVNSEEMLKPSKEIVRSQILYDSDEDIFSPSHEENSTKSKSGTKNRKIIIESDDDIMAFNVPMKAVNTRKRSTNDMEDGGSNRKIPKTVINSKTNNKIKKVVPQQSTKKALNDEVDKSISRAPASTSQISRKRDLEDEVFNFDDLPNRHQIKKPRNTKKNENSSEELTSVASTSTSTSSIKAFSFKTSKISDKEAYASFVYDIDEDSGSWLSTRVSNIKVKDETHDEMDNSVNNSFDSHFSINVNIVRKNISLDTTCESKKSFRKQKYLESNQVVTLKKLNVNEMNYCYSKKEESGDD